MRGLRAAMQFVVVLAAVATPGAATPAARFPSAPLQSYFEAQRATGAERSEPLARAVLWSAERRPEAERHALRELAAQADPVLPAPHLARARAALRHGDVPDFCTAVGAALQAIRRDVRSEARALQGGFRTAHALLTATLLTLAALLALRSLRLARHVVGAFLGSQSAAPLLVVVPFAAALLTLPAIGGLLALVAMAPFVRRREARVAAVPCLLLAVLEIGLHVCAPHAVLLDPRTRSSRIAYLNDHGHDAGLERELASDPVRGADVELVLGLQARRRGDAASAERHFLAALRADSTCAAAYVDLANLFFRRGNYSLAATGYRTAQTMAPEDPLAYANLAQAYIRTTQFLDSDRELRAASERGITDVVRRRQLWRDEVEPVFDATLSRAALLDLAQRELATRPQLAADVLEAWRSPLWQGMLPGVAPGALLLAAAWLLRGMRLRRLARPCTDCGTMVCSHCIDQFPGDDRCNTCQIARPQARAVSVDLVTPEQRRRMSLTSGRWVAPMFPGAADLVRGTPVAALGAIVCTWAALLGAHAAVDAARLRTSPWWIGADLRAVQVAAVVVGLLWLPGLLRLRTRERARASRGGARLRGA